MFQNHILLNFFVGSNFNIVWIMTDDLMKKIKFYMLYYESSFSMTNIGKYHLKIISYDLFHFWLLFFIQVRLLGAEQPMSAGRSDIQFLRKYFSLLEISIFFIHFWKKYFRSRELVCEAVGGRPKPTFTWWKVMMGGVQMI